MTTAPRFDVGQATTLFTTRITFPADPSGSTFPYDVAADGQRFLFSNLRTDAAAITVVLNWPSTLKPQAP